MAIANVGRRAPVPETAAAYEEKSKLQKHFRSLDIFFFLLCTLVGLDTIGSVAHNGAQGFTWLAFMAVFFFLPYGLLTAELGSSFSQEGGLYIWTRLAFGRLAGGMAALFYWFTDPIWVGGTLALTALTAVNTFITPITGVAKYVFALLFIWATIASAIATLKYGKWLTTAGAYTRVGVLLFFTLSVLLYALRHGLHGFAGRDFHPTYAVFIAVVPVLAFNYVGFELPCSAGDEMAEPQRDVPLMVAWSALGAILMYGLPILAILLVLPVSQITGLGGLLDAVKAVFTVYGGHVAADGTATLTGAGKALGDVMAVAFVVGLITSGIAWIIGSDRTLAVACYDGAGPRGLGRFSARYGTPVAVNLLSGVVATVTMFLAFALSGGSTAKYFSAILGLTISTNMIAYLLVFPAFIRLHHTHPHVPRPYRVPGGRVGVWICGVLSTFWALLATVGLVWPGFGLGWFGNRGMPDDALPSGFGGQRLGYELTQIVPIALLVLLGLGFYAWGRRTREESADAVDPRPVL